MKKVIINADDLALSEGTNTGIINAIKDGIVSSTSIMACGDAFEHAISLLKENNFSGLVGVHLVLDEEKPLLSPADISTIVNDKGLFLSRGELLKNLLVFKKINLDHIRSEFRAQIQKIIDSGIKPSHLDGHGHVHVYPGINKIIIELANEFNIKKIRLPAESYFYFDLKNFKLKKYINKLIVTTFSLLSKRLFKKSGLIYPAGFMGMLFGGNLNTSNLKKILSSIPSAENFEIMSHPGISDLQRSDKYKHWNYKWENEFNALTSMDKNQLSQKYNLEIISFNDL
ncbi:MAG: ChbG/HpnK family deacetylase [Deltaproteobacteria bacterium]|nr:ChbG/HpnK family deacetylase [Deltaproteobacteria bacterium]